jgi:hypothetical protein
MSFILSGVDWATIDELKKSYNEQHQFNDFFRKLFINLSDENAYTYGDFDVKVSDVTEDFEYFAKCNEASKHKPKTEKGSNGEDKFSDTETDPVALACYNTKGKIKMSGFIRRKKNKLKFYPKFLH